jgi:hypothetical protein
MPARAPAVPMFAVAAALMLAASAQAQSPEASQAQDLSNCAGAVAAFADADIMRHPEGSSGVWSIVLGDILARLNREPGVEGMTGRIAANAARAYWAERPRAAQEQAATRCRARFGSQ